MCYNVAYLEKRAQKYAERYRDVPQPGYQLQLEGVLDTWYFLSGFVHPALPLVCHDRIALLRWGLIPAWVKNEQQAKEMASRTLNAKGETAFEKPSFRKPIRSQRGLLGVSGFFEWREFKGKKYPYYVQVKDEELFSLGCIYDSWVDTETGEIRDTFSILTTPANPLMAVVHNQKLRMPLIIDRADEPRWVQPDLPHEDVRRLIKPFDEKKMTAYPVSNKINSPRNERNTPEAIRRVDYPELPPVNV